MDRRELLGVLGASAVGLASVAGREARAQEGGHTHDKVHEECLKACSDCAKMCDETFHHCYMEVSQGKKEHAKSLHLVSDCAGFCSLSACMIARHSPLMVHSCAACAEACKATAAEVGKFDSPEMKAATKSLLACEKSCREMVAHMGKHQHAAGAACDEAAARKRRRPRRPGRTALGPLRRPSRSREGGSRSKAVAGRSDIFVEVLMSRAVVSGIRARPAVARLDRIGHPTGGSVFPGFRTAPLVILTRPIRSRRRACDRPVSWVRGGRGMSIGTRTVLALGLIGLASSGRGAEFPTFRAQEIDPNVGNVCYAVTTADVDGDGKLDVVAVTEDAVVWFANPGWKKHTIIKDATERDNVCIQAHDIDGDGKVDFALGAGWQPTDTKAGGTLQWLKRTGDGDDDAPGRSSRSAREPTLHRIRWGDVLGTGKKQLVVAPLQGRGTKGPNWGEGPGVRVLVYTVPDDPAEQPLAGRGRRRHAAHDPQPPARRLRRRRPRRDRARRLGRGVRPARPRPGRPLVEDPARRGQPGGEAVQGVERGQGRPPGRRPPLHRHDRALARLPGRRLHAPDVGRPGSGSAR